MPRAVVQFDDARVRTALLGQPAVTPVRSRSDDPGTTAVVRRQSVGVAVVQSGYTVGSRVELEGRHAGSRVEAVAEAHCHAQQDQDDEDNGQ